MSAQPEDGDYGVCKTCGIPIPTPDDSRAHMAATHVGGARSHTITIINPTPSERARSRIARMVEDATNDFCEDLDDLVRKEEMSVKDVTDAINGYPDFADAWAEWLEENDESENDEVDTEDGDDEENDEWAPVPHVPGQLSLIDDDEEK